MFIVSLEGVFRVTFVAFVRSVEKGLGYDFVLFDASCTCFGVYMVDLQEGASNRPDEEYRG